MPDMSETALPVESDPSLQEGEGLVGNNEVSKYYYYTSITSIAN